MTPQQTIEAINSFMAANPKAHRFDIAKGVGVTLATIMRYHDKGLVTLPKSLSPSQAAKIGRKKAEAKGKHFVINRNKPQVWQTA